MEAATMLAAGAPLVVVLGVVSPNRRKFRGVSEDGNSSLKQKFTPAASQIFDVREPGSVVGE